jgi:hypothetical protein
LERDRILHLLRWVVTPIALAIIAGYFQMRTAANTAQTKASYETLAPNVLELQAQVAVLTGRVEELARRPIFMFPEAATRAPKVDAQKPRTGLGALGTGKIEPMVDHIAPPPPEHTPSPKKIPARFDDMIQQKKY